MNVEALVVLLLAALLVSVIYLRWRGQQEPTKPVDPQEEYLDAVEDEAYFRIRAMLDADEAVRQTRRRKQ